MLTLSINDEGITLPLRALPSRRISGEQMPGLSLLHVNVVSGKSNRDHVNLKIQISREVPIKASLINSTISPSSHFGH